jgi:hypothetical protein
MELQCAPNPSHSKTIVLQTISQETMFYNDSSSREIYEGRNEGQEQQFFVK